MLGGPPYANRWSMPKISKAQLLRALSAAEKTRPVHANPFQAPVVKRPHQLRGERALNELLVSSFAKGSLDLKKLKQIRDQHKTELRRVMEKEKRDAIKQAARARKILKARIAHQRQALQARLAAPLAPPYPITLDKPFLIWASPRSNILFDSRIQSGNSWARVEVASKSSNSDKLSFYFLWNNPSDYHAVVNANTSLTLWGDCQAMAEGSLLHFYTPNFSGVVVTGYLYPWEWWNQPPTLTQEDHEDLGGVGAQAGLTDDSGLALLTGTYLLDTEQVVVAPNGTMVFEVAVAFDCTVVGGGSAHAAVEITCPSVELSLLTAPPLQVAGSLVSGIVGSRE
jgi:hypothetical protein